MRVAERVEREMERIRGVIASMGPQHESCGKAFLSVAHFHEIMLQWGRNMRVAESRLGFRRKESAGRFNGAAT